LALHLASLKPTGTFLSKQQAWCRRASGARAPARAPAQRHPRGGAAGREGGAPSRAAGEHRLWVCHGHPRVGL